MAVLRRFREHPSLGVRRQLVGTWERFDAERYAIEVLDHLETGPGLLCTSAEQLAALSRMRRWPDLTVRGPHHLADLVATVPEPETVNALELRDNPKVTDVTELLPFASLTELRLTRCGPVTSLKCLGALPLDLLALDRMTDVSGLRSLRSLTRLSVNLELPGTDLTEALPADAPLKFLFLGRNSTNNTGLRGLQHWQGLQTLSLGFLSKELTVTDWQAVAGLPNLTHLYISGLIVRQFPESITLMPELPGIEELFITSMHGVENLSRLGRAPARTAFCHPHEPAGESPPALTLRRRLPRGRGDSPDPLNGKGAGARRHRPLCSAEPPEAYAASLLRFGPAPPAACSIGGTSGSADFSSPRKVKVWDSPSPSVSTTTM